jgi:UDP:flavonoid glycosyltransferase YjiC (YdhE family)
MSYIRKEQPSPRALRRAIHRVLQQPRYRDASRRIAADMAAAPGLDGLTAILDGLTRPAAQGDDPQPALAS